MRVGGLRRVGTLRPVTVRISRKAEAGFTAQAWDAEIARDFIIDADGNPLLFPERSRRRGTQVREGG